MDLNNCLVPKPPAMGGDTSLDQVAKGFIQPGIEHHQGPTE